MATIEKRGESYRIIVSNGYDINGKQILEAMEIKNSFAGDDEAADREGPEPGGHTL